MDKYEVERKLTEMRDEARRAVIEEGMEDGSWERGWTLGYANGLDQSLHFLGLLTNNPDWRAVHDIQQNALERMLKAASEGRYDGSVPLAWLQGYVGIGLGL